jgi:hypothetical protein
MVEITLEQAVAAVINFITFPAWHLVALFAILFVVVALFIVSSLGF